MLGGCQLGYFLTPTETQEVKAEYARLEGKTVAVVVWAGRATLDIDPKARRRVCDAVVYEMKRHLPSAIYVSPRTIEDFQKNSGLDWESMDHTELCEHLKCDLLLRIDLLEYTTRAADVRELRKARVSASVAVYECGPTARPDAAYSADIEALYPPRGEQAPMEEDDRDLLNGARQMFAQMTARKFYDHEVTLRGRDAQK